VLVEIEMNNSAGLFQVDNLLRSKLRGSGLEDYIEVAATLEGETEKRLLPSFRL
jgi:metal-dependent HD superfamily phosphatase/phosphodiesterase